MPATEESGFVSISILRSFVTRCINAFAQQCFCEHHPLALILSFRRAACVPFGSCTLCRRDSFTLTRRLATIGPFGIICLLTITFTIGTRSVQKASVSLSDAGPMRNSVVSTRLSTRALNDIQSDRALSGTCRTARTADSESGRNTTNNNIHEGGKLAEEAPDETRERAKGGRGSRDSVRFAQTVLISRATAGSVGRNDEEAGGGMAPSAEISPPASPAPPRRGIGPLQRSVRGLSAAGPGSTMVEQVRCARSDDITIVSFCHFLM